MSSPLVSIVVPNYNYAQYLPVRVSSILKQTFTDYEIILLDDASTDNSVEVLNELVALPRVSHLVVNKKNSGSPFAQWMKGILLARGKYIWIAETDDLAKSDFLQTTVTLLEQNPTASFCYVGSYLMDAHENNLHKDVNHWGKRIRKHHAVFDGIQFAEHNLFWKNYIINASAVVFRRTYAQQLSKSAFVTMRYCGDYLFWFEMAIKGPVIEVYKVLNGFRQHHKKATIKSHNSGKGIQEDIRVVSFMLSRLPQVSPLKLSIRRGLLIRKMRHQHLDKETQKKLLIQIKQELSGSLRDFYFERITQICRTFLPFIPYAKRERL